MTVDCEDIKRTEPKDFASAAKTATQTHSTVLHMKDGRKITVLGSEPEIRKKIEDAMSKR